MRCVDVLFCPVDNPFFRQRVQILLKSHRFIGREPYPFPLLSDLSRLKPAYSIIGNLGGQSRRVKITVTLTQAVINQPQR